MEAYLDNFLHQNIKANDQHMLALTKADKGKFKAVRFRRLSFLSHASNRTY